MAVPTSISESNESKQNAKNPNEESNENNITNQVNCALEIKQVEKFPRSANYKLAEPVDVNVVASNLDELKHVSDKIGIVFLKKILFKSKMKF